MRKIENLTGYFDCRAYKANVPRNNRVIVKNGDRINFSVGFNQLEEIPEDVREFARKSEKSGKYYVTFKIFPKTCRLYTASNAKVDFPVYEAIDGGRFDVNIVYAVKHGTGTELNGVYVNALQVIRRADNPFEEVDGGSDSWVDGVDGDKTLSSPSPSPKNEELNSQEDDLPF